MRYGWWLVLALLIRMSDARAGITFACREANDLFAAVSRGRVEARRVESAREAVEAASDGSAVLILAEGYPEKRTAIEAEVYERAIEKRLSLYVEFPEDVPGIELGKVRRAQWERVVVGADARFTSALGKLRVLSAHQATFIESAGGGRASLVMARVAGYDTAVYGLPKDATPLLLRHPTRPWWIGTTKLSGFVTGRYAPAKEWGVVWETILQEMGAGEVKLKWEPDAWPAYRAEERLPAGAESEAFARAAKWYLNSGLLIAPRRQEEIRSLLLKGTEDVAPSSDEAGDGSLGILEGYSSGILPDGTQLQRTPIRADCQAETAMVLALDAKLNGRQRSGEVAKHLLNFMFGPQGMVAGRRGDTRHPSFGLIAWGIISPAWEVANYGDDNARAILATALAGTAIGRDAWDGNILRALLANLRTTGTRGFRGDRIDMPALESLGWRHFHDAPTMNLAPHFESGLWACYLWAFARTGEREFLERTREAIKLTMAAYPRQWRWGDNIERSRILLPLAWLVRLEDTPEHREWVRRITKDLLACQDEHGAIRERLRSTGGGHFQIPQSNEAYGTGETPLIQSNDDPACDQLYTTGFALLGLHECAAATGDADLARAADRLAEFLCRVQVRSEKHAWLDGAWMRAFDVSKWDYWASSADIGWGAWSLEAGWGQAWIAATLALRQERTTLWDALGGAELRKPLEKVSAEMKQNNGGPWQAVNPASQP